VFYPVRLACPAVKSIAAGLRFFYAKSGIELPLPAIRFVATAKPNGQMGLESIKQEIKKEIDKLNHALRVLSGVGRRQGRRKMSAAGRARIAAAQRKRWRKIRRNA
jgi:hypothetical protein